MPSHAATPVLKLEHFLPYKLSLVSNRISQHIARLYADRFGLGISEWRVVAVLGRYSGLSANEVAERTAMDKVAVSRVVSRLLVQGWISRTVAEQDRRRSVLQLTAKGQAGYAQIAPLALQEETRLLQVFSAEERQQLNVLLEKLNASIAAMAAAAPASSSAHFAPRQRSA